MNERARIGFVGVGNMGQAAHLRNYTSLDSCQVVAIAEPRADLARRVAAKYGIEKIYRSAEEMMAAETLDGLVASQPFDRHLALVGPLYKYGIPVFTEKPLASTVESGDRLLQELASGGSWHMVGYMKRNDLAVQWAVREIASLKSSGRLGALRYVRITMPPGDWIAGGFDELVRTDEPAPAVPEDPRPPDMCTQQFREYVSFVNYYIHQVNLLRYLLDEPYMATFADKAGRVLIGETESGVTGAIEMAPYQTTRDWDERALIGFDKGYIKVGLQAPLVLTRAGTVEAFYDGSGEPTRVSPVLPSEHAMRSQARNFIESIQGRSKPACEAAEALIDLQVARDYMRLMWART